VAERLAARQAKRVPVPTSIPASAFPSLRFDFVFAFDFAFDFDSLKQCAAPVDRAVSLSTMLFVLV